MFNIVRLFLHPVSLRIADDEGAVFYAAALYPESEKLIQVSSLFKVEGTFLNPADGYKMGWGVGGRAEKQGFALLMVDEGDSTTMLHWIVGLADVFKVIFFSLRGLR